MGSNVNVIDALTSTNLRLEEMNDVLVSTNAALVSTNAVLVSTNAALVAKNASLIAKLEVADAWDKVNDMIIRNSEKAIRLLEQERVCDRTSRTLEIKRACNNPVAYFNEQQTTAPNMKLKVSKVGITFAYV